MDVVEVEDKLEVLGLLVGAFVVLVGIGTLVGAPWETNNNAIASVIQIVGVVATVAIGLGLARLSYVSE